MRKDVKKILFWGLAQDKETFFKNAQSLGFVHFIDPNGLQKDIPQDVQKLTEVLKILRGFPPKEQVEIEDAEFLNADKLIQSITNLHSQNEKLLEEQRVLGMEIARIEVFGNFSLEDVAYIEKHGNYHLQFFCGKEHLFEESTLPETLFFVASENGLDYYLSIHKHMITYDSLIEIKIERSLSELKHQYQSALQEQKQIERVLKEKAQYQKFLHHILIEKLNLYHLHHAQTYVQHVMGDALFAVEGWVPTNKIQQLEKLTAALHIHYEEIVVEATDVIPTYLENKGPARLGEDLVHIYDTPSATDKDPSIWVLACFALFFAMIIGDAGYGLIYLCIALFIRYRYPNLKGAAQRILNLFTLLSVGCIVWGTLTTSFFGMQVDLDNPIRKVSLIHWLAEKKADYHLQHRDETFKNWVETYPDLENVQNVKQLIRFSPEQNGEPVLFGKITDNIMFELALFIGVLHLLLSLIRYVNRNWQNIGWVAFLIGAYLYFPYYLGIPSILNFVGGIDLVQGGELGLQLMVAGIGVAWILSIIRFGWTGIFEIMTLIQVFADTLSYLRLYALGLAGAIIGSTVNEIASGLPLLLGAALVVLSHLINIVLGTMSGVIHGLRLNFLEWYHYSFEGGGKQFQPLKLLKKNNA